MWVELGGNKLSQKKVAPKNVTVEIKKEPEIKDKDNL